MLDQVFCTFVHMNLDDKVKVFIFKQKLENMVLQWKKHFLIKDDKRM